METLCAGRIRRRLVRIRGPTSFKVLKIVNGQKEATFREACETMTTSSSLPEDDGHWDATMNDAMLSSGQGGLYFLDALVGTGKTFLLNFLLAQLHKNKVIALAVASSGVAATLLSGGRTAHSVFKLLLNIASEETHLKHQQK
ncbi:hypothetical protein EVAR_11639_1 [Eumeta japonica]|uniref:ATP-dependent DNA helicase n=1 Tax=Eumeta variegata TaxID=151549 RepID=A0A4C1WTQ2_EUMVA|nr:hypothetical protein EVAR_11639_1 [Eumeta japonica]